MSRTQPIPPNLQPVARSWEPRAPIDMVCYISNTPGAIMTPTWTDQAPIYQQLADRLAVQLLDGSPPEGEALPSVRALASQYVINPLTVTRALQALAEHGLIETRRGLGMFVTAGARERLLLQERARFLQRDWPALRAKLKRLGLTAKDLNWEST